MFFYITYPLLRRLLLLLTLCVILRSAVVPGREFPPAFLFSLDEFAPRGREKRHVVRTFATAKVGTHIVVRS